MFPRRGTVRGREGGREIENGMSCRLNEDQYEDVVDFRFPVREVM